MDQPQNDQKKETHTPINTNMAPKATPKIVSIMEDEKFLATLSYVPMGFLLPLLAQPQNQKLKFHAKQGMIFFIGWILVLIIMVVWTTLGLLAFLLYFAINIIVLYRTYTGETWKMPVVGDFAEKVDVNLPGGQQKTAENKTQPEKPAAGDTPSPESNSTAENLPKTEKLEGQAKSREEKGK